MKKQTIHISPRACSPLKEYLSANGYTLEFTEEINTLFHSSPISLHPDILYCHISDGQVFCGKPSQLQPVYPKDCIYNGCSTGKYFIHKLSITDSTLLRVCMQAGLKPIDVPQGYTRCSALPVDSDSIITYDRGIARACKENGGPEVLLVHSGNVTLSGYNTGFIGGTAGRIEDEIIFNGDISAHPDFSAIRDFISERNLSLRYFETEPLTDIGSIIEEKIKISL